MQSAAVKPTMSPWRGWELFAALPVTVLLFTPSDWPRWVLMWLLAGTIYFGCKWLTWRRTPIARVPAWRHAAYLLAWPGMDAERFLSNQPLTETQRPTTFEWLFAALKLLFGITVFWGVSRLFSTDQTALLGWTGMVGLIFMLHFGSFHLLSCGWRAMGIDARPLMNNPIASTSISDFWGRRWNIAVRDLTHRFLFRPLTIKWGARKATIAGFFVSGIVHDVVISIPARAGYGGPTLYFLIQGFALLAERSKFAKAIGLGSGWRGWLFTVLVLLLPVPLLFHLPFLREVIVPFMKALGAA
jgi:hypothetical protein